MRNLSKSVFALILTLFFLGGMFQSVQIFTLAAKEVSTSTYRVKLSSTKLTYNEKNQYPIVSVKNSDGKTLVKNTDYKIIYPKSSKNIGEYKLEIRYIGKYTGKEVFTYFILPKNVTNLKYEQGTGKFKEKRSPWVYYSDVIDENYAYVTREINGVNLSWKKVSPADGYRVYILKSGKWTKVADTKDTKYTVKNLTSGKAYQFTVKAYKTVNGKKYSSASFTSIVAASRPNCTPLKVKIKNNQAYITWEKQVCSGYYLYVSFNRSEYKRININNNNTLQYIYKYPAFADSITIKIKAYTTTGNSKTFSTYKTRGERVTPRATRTNGGISVKPATSKEAKKIINDWMPWIPEMGYTCFEGKSADGKKTVVYCNPSGEWWGKDKEGTRYDTYGKIKICEYCGRQMGEKDNMCHGDCAIVFH